MPVVWKCLLNLLYQRCVFAALGLLVQVVTKKNFAHGQGLCFVEVGELPLYQSNPGHPLLWSLTCAAPQNAAP